MEGSDGVLGLGQVDGRLPADAGIHHPRERRRHRDPRDAPQVGRRHEARDVGRRAAAEPDDDVAALDAEVGKTRPCLPRDGHGLGRLARGKANRHERLDRRPEHAQNRPVGDERRPARAHEAGQLRQRGRPRQRREQGLLAPEVVRVDERVAGGVVERPALLVELGEPARLDRERTVAGIGLDTAPRRLRRHVQKHGEAPVAEPPAGHRRQDRPSAEREHCIRLSEQAADHALLERPERRLAVLLEDRGDRPAGLPLDLAVGVQERPPQPGGQRLARARLARAHEADQREVAEGARDHARAMRST